jgi:hypothetical protein
MLGGAVETFTVLARHFRASSMPVNPPRVASALGHDEDFIPIRRYDRHHEGQGRQPAYDICRVLPFVVLCPA